MSTTTHTFSCYRLRTLSSSCRFDPSLHRLRIELTKRSPGDYLPHDVDEIEGFKQRLNERLAPTGSLKEASTENDWTVHSTLAQWYRPNYETFMYPYLPPHCTRPKECKKLYLLELPHSRVLSVPKNMKLLAVPLFELYDNTQRYGPQLSAIPHYLSRFRWEFVDDEGKVVSWTPGGPIDERVKTKILAGGDDEANGHGAAAEDTMQEGA
jgi:cleavage and polyadenylation specificity factor subunit 5